jgi:hypothetical protein
MGRKGFHVCMYNIWMGRKGFNIFYKHCTGGRTYLIEYMGRKAFHAAVGMCVWGGKIAIYNIMGKGYV